MTHTFKEVAAALFFVLFSAFTFYLTFNQHFELPEMQSLFSIVGSFSIGLAVLTYFYKKKQDKLLATIDQISFFRKEIIPEWDLLQKRIINAHKDFIVSQISLETPTLEYAKKSKPENFKRQLSVFFNPEKQYPDVAIDPLLDGHIFLLNILEEFSLRVLHLGTSDDRALNSVHRAFVEIVEKNAVALTFMREIRGRGPLYSGILELYNLWKNKVQKTPFLIKSFEQHGLIGKKQREDFYKQRKRAAGY